MKPPRSLRSLPPEGAHAAARRSRIRACPRSVAQLAIALGFVIAEAQAESLRCEGGIASEGDSRLSVLYKCGQPHLADASCAPVFYGSTLNPVPEPYASLYVPCLPVEEWIYERGPGSLVATVRIRAGKVQSITYGHAPR